MPKVAVLDMTGKKVSDIDLNEAIFGIEPNTAVMHMAVVNFLANRRQGTQSTKTRAEVRGGGRKPWRQKGTGNARQGSIRSPQWRHGGVALGPKPRDYSYSLNKKVRKLALFSALSSKVADENFVVVDDFEINEYKTKAVIAAFEALKAGKKVLLVLDNNSKFTVKSASNLSGVKTAQYNTISTYDLINADTVIMAKGAITSIEEVYA